MAEPSWLDPFALVRDLVSRLEKGVNEFANPLMKTDGYSQGANKVMSAVMVAKKLAQDLTQRYFEALNVPSRSNLLALGDRIQSMEDRLIDIQSTLDRLSGGESRPALPTPARTRKPPAPAPVVETVAVARKRTRRARS